MEARREHMFKDRKRELLQAPIFHGAPASNVSGYIKGRLDTFRKDHEEFDLFLGEIGQLILKSYNEDYKDIVTYIESTKPIRSNRCLCDVFVDLFNMDLSPKQAFDYIQKCYSLYTFIKGENYQIDNEYEISVRRSRWDGKPRKFITVDLNPKKQPPDWDDYYWFRITFSSLVIEDHLNDITLQADTTIKIINSQYKFENTLRLFEYNQGKEFLRRLFETAVEQLLELKIIKEVERYNHPTFTKLIVHKYAFKDIVGRHQLNNMSYN